MSKFQINFKLKQHTPLIHFQHDQAGATLRATELKPKLDKFILSKLGDGDKDAGYIKAKEKGWLVGNGEHRALDYKVRIQGLSNPNFGEVAVMPSNLEQWTLIERNTFVITCFHTNLLKEIDNELINGFFVMHNFGKRQNKGFGCFYPENLSQNDFERLLKKFATTTFKSRDNLRNEVQLDTYFYDGIIFKSWGRLKSGKNYGGYEKSRVFDYLAENRFRWDKRWIKRKLKALIDTRRLPAPLQDKGNSPIDYTHRNNWEDEDDTAYRFGRALLGLAEHYEYRAERRYLYQVKISNSDIERFKSPITFKVFNRSIYAFIESIDKRIYDTSFSFEVQKKRNNQKEGAPIRIQGTLKTPSKTEFVMEEFLNDYFKTVGFNKLR